MLVATRRPRGDIRFCQRCTSPVHKTDTYELGSVGDVQGQMLYDWIQVNEPCGCELSETETPCVKMDPGMAALVALVKEADS